MNTSKLAAGQALPEITLPKLGGGTLNLGQPKEGLDWQLIVVYRGKHCPLCTRYLGDLNELLPELNNMGIDVVAISGDPQEKAESQIGQIEPDYAVGYDLSVEQMQALGLYISNPRSAEETDRLFAEPGVFVVNSDGNVQVTDISNAPFARPDLKSLARGLKFIRDPENNYPVRGTYTPS